MPISYDRPPFAPPPLWEAVPDQHEQEPRRTSINCGKNSIFDVQLRAAYNNQTPRFHNGTSYLVESMTVQGDGVRYGLVEIIPLRRLTIPAAKMMDIVDPQSGALPTLPALPGPVVRALQQILDYELLASAPDPLVSTQAPPLPPPFPMNPPVVMIAQEHEEELKQLLANTPLGPLMPGPSPTLPAPPSFAMVETRAQQAVQRALQKPQHQRAGLLGLASHYDW
jgi:hypothetical protein